MSRALRRMLLGLAAALSLAGAPSLVAQGADASSRLEDRLLRDAAALEARGDLAAAEAALRSLLERVPASAGALFALERVLRARDRLETLLPIAERYLRADPDAAGARLMKLRVLAEMDSLPAMQAAAEEWISASPRAADPYREVSRLYAVAFGPERALEVLRRGSGLVADPSLLAPEMGDLLARMGRPAEAVEAWSRGVRADGEGGQRVLRRLRRVEGERAALAAALSEALVRPPTTAARKRVAVEAALDAGLAERALDLAAQVADEMGSEGRAAFLEDAARWAEIAGSPALRLWAYIRLREGATGGAARNRALDVRIVEAALAMGDTAAAVRAGVRLASGLPTGSTERRRALASLVSLEAAVAEPADVRRRLAAFREEFPGASETDALAARVAGALQALGREAEAAQVLEGVSGPRSSLERAYLRLAEGDVEAGRQALLDAVAGLDPSVATDVIELAGLLGRLSPSAARALATAAVAAHRGRGGEAAAVLASSAGEVPADERPPLLAHAARLADAAGDGAGAARLRARLVEQYADAPETAAATLALARWRAALGTPGDLEEAARLLEALILSSPRSAIVPAARRELERVRGRIP